MERFSKQGPETFLEFMANRYKQLRAEYRETRALAVMSLDADDLGMMEWARVCAQGVKILKAAWSTGLFVAEERMMVSLLAQLAEGDTTSPHCDAVGRGVHSIAYGKPPVYWIPNTSNYKLTIYQ